MSSSPGSPLMWPWLQTTLPSASHSGSKGLACTANPSGAPKAEGRVHTSLPQVTREGCSHDQCEGCRQIEVDSELGDQVNE